MSDVDKVTEEIRDKRILKAFNDMLIRNPRLVVLPFKIKWAIAQRRASGDVDSGSGRKVLMRYGRGR